MRKIFFCLFFIGFLGQLQAQEILTLEQAIQEALEKNYAIVITQQNEQIANNNFTKGNAGQLPQVNFNAGVTYSNNNTQFEFATGDTQARNNAFSLGTNTSIGLNYVIYGGRAGQLNYQRFETLIQQSETQTRQAIETTLAQVFQNYYEVARLTEEYKVTLEAIQISQDRIQRAEARNEFGTGNQLAILNAQVDLNADSLNAVTAKVNLDNAKRNLCLLLARPLSTDFEVETEVSYLEAPNLENLAQEALENNVNLILLEYNKRILEQNQQIINAGRMPTVSLNLAYAFNRSQTDAGFILANRSYGLNGGITLLVPIFDGYRRRIQIQNTQVEIETNELRKKQLEEQLYRDLSNALAVYENALYILQMQERNLQIAQENFSQTEQRFDYGQITTTQFREAQLNFIRAKSGLNTAKFVAKIAEIELIRLIGGFRQE